jgi:membrane protease YdiL (CAAX protease family)
MIYYIFILFALGNIVFNPAIKLNFKEITYIQLIIMIFILLGAFVLALTFYQPNKYSTLLPAKEKVLQLLKFVIYVPIIEEIIYRGYIQASFLKTFNIIVTTVIVSFIFIINHNFNNKRLYYLLIYSPILSVLAYHNFFLNLSLHIVVNLGCYLRFYNFRISRILPTNNQMSLFF